MAAASTMLPSRLASFLARAEHGVGTWGGRDHGAGLTPLAGDGLGLALVANQHSAGGLASDWLGKDTGGRTAAGPTPRTQW